MPGVGEGATFPVATRAMQSWTTPADAAGERRVPSFFLNEYDLDIRQSALDARV